MSAVVSDTSPHLVECEAVKILPQLFGEVLIPPTVHRELQHTRTPPQVLAWARDLPSWMRVQAPLSVDPALKLDEGEREAICLAREVKAVAILMDDRKGRMEAQRCGIRVTGTIGLLEAAARRDLVDFERAVQRLRRTNARLEPFWENCSRVCPHPNPLPQEREWRWMWVQDSFGLRPATVLENSNQRGMFRLLPLGGRRPG